MNIILCKKKIVDNSQSMCHSKRAKKARKFERKKKKKFCNIFYAQWARNILEPGKPDKKFIQKQHPGFKNQMWLLDCLPHDTNQSFSFMLHMSVMFRFVFFFVGVRRIQLFHKRPGQNRTGLFQRGLRVDQRSIQFTYKCVWRIASGNMHVFETHGPTQLHTRRF